MKHRKSKRIYADYTLPGSMIQFYVLKYSEKFIVEKRVVHLLFTSVQFTVQQAPKGNTPGMPRYQN